MIFDSFSSSVSLHPPSLYSLLFFEVAEPMAPLLRPWWMEMDVVVLGTVGCASVVFLLSAIIICYKAIKRFDVFLTSVAASQLHRTLVYFTEMS